MQKIAHYLSQVKLHNKHGKTCKDGTQCPHKKYLEKLTNHPWGSFDHEVANKWPHATPSATFGFCPSTN